MRTPLFTQELDPPLVTEKSAPEYLRGNTQAPVNQQAQKASPIMWVGGQWTIRKTLPNSSWQPRWACGHKLVFKLLASGCSDSCSLLSGPSFRCNHEKEAGP